MVCGNTGKNRELTLEDVLRYKPIFKKLRVCLQIIYLV